MKCVASFNGERILHDSFITIILVLILVTVCFSLFICSKYIYIYRYVVLIEIVSSEYKSGKEDKSY
jgi:hypothetical protein